MRNIYFFALIFLTNIILGQEQFPPHIDWKTIKTKNFQVIFPKEADKAAQKAINYLEHSKYYVDSSLKVQSKKIPVLLNNQSVISNGYVQLAPRYMCWYLTPPQDASTSLEGTDWMYLLALHEQRHVSQYERLDDNFTDFLSDLTGDFGRAWGINISTPIWYFEGDAIHSETCNSLSGRGRMPFFMRDFMAMEDHNIRYSYNKALFGSYKNYTPNHYNLGYILVDHINRNYGEESWDKIHERTTKYSFNPFIFSRSLKLCTGYNLKQTYKNALDEYNSIWQSNVVNKTDQNYERIKGNSNAKIRTHYVMPQFLSADSIIAVKYGFSENPTLVLLNQGNEIFIKEISYIDRISANSNIIIWNQDFYDIRWLQKSYSDIMALDLTTGKTNRITHNQKLFAPVLSPNGKMIAAIEFSAKTNCSLIILEYPSGKELKRFHLEMDELARMPSWSKDSKKLVFTVTKNQDKEIRAISAENGQVLFSQNFGIENVTNPIFYFNSILFNSPLKGIDQIHAIDMEDKKRYLAVESNYGAYNPQVSSRGKIAFQEYNNTGFAVCTKDAKPGAWKEIKVKHIESENYLYNITPIKANALMPEDMNDSVYSVSDYSPLKNSFFFHSWQPTFGYRRIGAMAYSNDVLNNLDLQAGIDYYPKEQVHREFLSMQYSALYPVIGVELSHGDRFEFNQDTSVDDYMHIYENIVDANLTLPFVLANGVYTTNLSISGGLLNSRKHFYQYEDSVDFSPDFNSTSPYFSVDFVRHKRLAYRDIYSRFGQEISFRYITSSINNSNNDKRGTLSGKLFFPGMFKHHSLRISAGIEMKENPQLESIYLYDTQLEWVRGYDDFHYDYSQRLTVDYSLPLAYPDLNLGSVLYLKRIHSSAFYDMGVYRYFSEVHSPSSAGIDLNFEFFLFRLPIPFEMGVRYAHRLEDNQSRIEILIFRQTL